MAEVKLTVRAETRFWFHFAFEALAWVCALTSLISKRAAHWISSTGSVAIARHGIKLTAD